MRFASLSDRGKTRLHNEDNYLVRGDDAVPYAIVADGMGGHRAGDLASAKAVQEVATYFARKPLADVRDVLSLIQDAMVFANEHVFAMSRANDAYSGMGTTMDVALWRDGMLYIGHVGDSRVYYLHDGVMEQLTRDHTLIEMMLENGTITPEEAKNHPQRHFITRALGTDSDLEVDLLSMPFGAEDALLLCTDGLTNMVSDDEIVEIIASCEDCDAAVHALIARANEAGGSDNITAVLVGDHQSSLKGR